MGYSFMLAVSIAYLPQLSERKQRSIFLSRQPLQCINFPNRRKTVFYALKQFQFAIYTSLCYIKEDFKLSGIR